MRTHQKPTVKPTPNPPESEKLDPAWCGFSNQKPTPIHTISTSSRLKRSCRRDVSKKNIDVEKHTFNMLFLLFFHKFFSQN
jgi:hypothetical protein